MVGVRNAPKPRAMHRQVRAHLPHDPYARTSPPPRSGSGSPSAPRLETAPYPDSPPNPAAAKPTPTTRRAPPSPRQTHPQTAAATKCPAPHPWLAAQGQSPRMSRTSAPPTNATRPSATEASADAPNSCAPTRWSRVKRLPPPSRRNRRKALPIRLIAPEQPQPPTRPVPPRSSRPPPDTATAASHSSSAASHSPVPHSAHCRLQIPDRARPPCGPAPRGHSQNAHSPVHPPRPAPPGAVKT